MVIVLSINRSLILRSNPGKNIMKTITLGVFALVMSIGVLGYLPTAYINERCGQMESLLMEEQDNPEMYPGLQLTASLKNACPDIEYNLIPIVSQSSATDDGDIWEVITTFQTESRSRALDLESGIAFE